MDKINYCSAIIVTYNRLNDLKMCIDSVMHQTVQCDIIVVNNGSTDGTKEYLDSIKANVKVINQANLGGAGGFYAGSELAYKNGYEWIWMMDDDGIPASNQLEQLLSVANKHDLKVLNALVVNKEDHTRLAFGKQELLSSLELGYDIVEQPLSPFNGTFIHRSVIDKVGFIKKEMFIWGDEQEYMARIRKGGFKPYTATRAIHYHPREKGTKRWAIPFIKKGQVIEKPDRMSHYFYRNMGYLNWHYRGLIVTLKTAIYYIFFLIRKRKFSELTKFFKYYKNGILNNYK